jgi:Kef-type K+ transport system membrane component KefB/nucleotide-binding universal stress UspA family protein
MNIIVLVLIEILVVIGLSRIFGWGFRAISQPLVIGEIVAGIALGPSLLGSLSPDFAAALFPSSTIPYLNILSQVGLIFFMFLIGLELDPKYLQGNLKIAVLTSTVSIIVPFSLAGILSLWLYPLVSNAGVSFTAFALFMGAAMSITAFPVLARIITENNLQNSRLGTLALTCAAVDDVTAWCLLALAIAVTRTNSIAAAIPQIIYSIIYIGLMLTVGRWILQTLSTYYDRTGKLSQILLAGIYMAVVASAIITETIGIHLIFGAFLLGAAMPKNPGMVRDIAEKTEDFVLIFLLPIFFAYSGLKTQIGLIDSVELWSICGAILVVAIAGKFIGTYFAARSFKIDRRESAALGWLMNTRGLTELIVLNIGLDLGVISPLLFTMLVIMALVTTFMTSPLLEWTYPKRLIRLTQIPTPSQPTSLSAPAVVPYRVLLPVANPKTQQGLLQLAVAIAHNPLQPAIVNPLSLIELEEDYLYQSTPAEADRLIANKMAKLQDLIDTLGLPAERKIVKPIVEIGYDVAQRMASIANLDRPDLILMGWHRPTLTKNRLGGRVARILTSTPADVAVFIDANTIPPYAYRSLLVPYRGHDHDDLALELALRLIGNNPRRRLHIAQLKDREEESNDDVTELLAELPPEWQSRVDISTIETQNPIARAIELSQQVDLTLAGIGRVNSGRYQLTLERYANELAIDCASSLLIARRYSQFRSHLTPAFVERT